MVGGSIAMLEAVVTVVGFVWGAATVGAVDDVVVAGGAAIGDAAETARKGFRLQFMAIMQCRGCASALCVVGTGLCGLYLEFPFPHHDSSAIHNG